MSFCCCFLKMHHNEFKHILVLLSRVKVLSVHDNEVVVVVDEFLFGHVTSNTIIISYL